MSDQNNKIIKIEADDAFPTERSLHTIDINTDLGISKTVLSPK